jgi:hypothetical protein
VHVVGGGGGEGGADERRDGEVEGVGGGLHGVRRWGWGAVMGLESREAAAGARLYEGSLGKEVGEVGT